MRIWLIAASALNNSLTLMWQGMLAIFLGIGLIAVLVVAMNAIAAAAAKRGKVEE